MTGRSIFFGRVCSLRLFPLFPLPRSPFRTMVPAFSRPAGKIFLSRLIISRSRKHTGGCISILRGRNRESLRPVGILFAVSRRKEPERERQTEIQRERERKSSACKNYCSPDRRGHRNYFCVSPSEVA
ncbi:hypothetical protein PUN28_018822 [Cardiocondyla obscurior]|uniref:Uncharacterized protein n=1 Tax=Cardiocondyla obscurior TaxID=286306 RepID=A0AAW2ED23_9HYME